MPPQLTRSRCVYALVLALATPAVAHAAPPKVLLQVEGTRDTSCPPDEALRASVIARLGRSPFVADVSAVDEDESVDKVRVILDVTNTRSRGTLAIQGGDGSEAMRVLEARSCPALLDAIALAMAISLDPGGAFGPPATESEPRPVEPEEPPGAKAPPPTETEKPLVAPEEQPPSAKAAESTPIVISLGVGLGAGIGQHDQPHQTTEAILQASSGSLSVVLAPAVSLALPSSTQSSLVGGDLALCGHLNVVGLCSSTRVGWLAASSSSSDTSRGAVFVATGARLSLELPVYQSISLGGHLDVWGTIAGVRLVDAATGSVLFQSPPVSSALALVVLWRL